MAIIRSRLAAHPADTGLVFEEPEVARYIVVPHGDDGFGLNASDPAATDRHLQRLHAPGLARGSAAVVYFRTHASADARFTLRVNASREFAPAAVPGAHSWHEILAPGVLKPLDNEIVLAVSAGQVVFSDLVILYTANTLTVRREAVLDPG